MVSTSRFANFGSQSSNVVAQNAQVDLVSQKQCYQLQQSHGDATYGLVIGLANYEGQNIDGLMGNPIPTTLVSQGQSPIQHVTLSDAIIPSKPPIGFTNYEWQNMDSIATSMKQKHGNARFPHEFPKGLDNNRSQSLVVTQNLISNALMNYNNQSFQVKGTQDNADFQNKHSPRMSNYGNHNMDASQNSVPTTSANQDNYHFQPQMIEGDGILSSDLPIRLASNRYQNPNNPTQNNVPVASMIPNESQGITNVSSEFSIGLVNHGSQNIETSLQNHVLIGLTNYRSQNPNVDVNNPMLATLTSQNQSCGVDPFEWVRKFLLEDD